MRRSLLVLLVLVACAPTINRAESIELSYTTEGDLLVGTSTVGPIELFAADVQNVTVTSLFCSLTNGDQTDAKPDTCLPNAEGFTELRGELKTPRARLELGRVSADPSEGQLSVKVSGYEDGLSIPFTAAANLQSPCPRC